MPSSSKTAGREISFLALPKMSPFYQEIKQGFCPPTQDEKKKSNITIIIVQPNPIVFANFLKGLGSNFLRTKKRIFRNPGFSKALRNWLADGCQFSGWLFFLPADSISTASSLRPVTFARNGVSLAFFARKSSLNLLGSIWKWAGAGKWPENSEFWNPEHRWRHLDSWTYWILLPSNARVAKHSPFMLQFVKEQ